jgi:hypothetical protein
MPGLENLRASMYLNPMGLHGLSQGCIYHFTVNNNIETSFLSSDLNPLLWLYFRSTPILDINATAEHINPKCYIRNDAIRFEGRPETKKVWKHPRKMLELQKNEVNVDTAKREIHDILKKRTNKQKTNTVVLVRERTIPTERPPLVGDVYANFYVVGGTDPHCRILGFLDRSRYCFCQVAPRLHSWGWADPVPDPLHRKSGRIRNRTTTTRLFRIFLSAIPLSVWY